MSERISRDIESDHLLDSINDTARKLGVCRRTVNKLLSSGDLHGVKIGRRHLIPVSETSAFIQRQLDRAAQS
mgnify:CR=1 FL=1|jgi:excisionase family DNA binding protein